MIGQVLGHCRVLAKLGEGGMGIVYRAYDEVLHRDVALKVVKKSEIAHRGFEADVAELDRRLGRYAEAEALLEHCLDLAPGFDAARHNLVIVLHRQQKALDALKKHQDTSDDLKKVLAMLPAEQTASIERFAKEAEAAGARLVRRRASRVRPAPASS